MNPIETLSPRPEVCETCGSNDPKVRYHQHHIPMHEGYWYPPHDNHEEMRSLTAEICSNDFHNDKCLAHGNACRSGDNLNCRFDGPCPFHLAEKNKQLDSNHSKWRQAAAETFKSLLRERDSTYVELENYKGILEAVREHAVIHVIGDIEIGEEGCMLCMLCGDSRDDIEVDGEVHRTEPDHDPSCPLSGERNTDILQDLEKLKDIEKAAKEVFIPLREDYYERHIPMTVQLKNLEKALESYKKKE